MRGGDFSTLWRLCIDSPSQPKLASSLHNKRLSYWRLTGFGRNDERGVRCYRHLERGCMPLWETDRNRSHDALSREISHRNAARTIRGGDFSTLWRLCIDSPSQPKLASSLHNKRLSYWRLTGFGRNDERARAGSFIICARRAPPPPSEPFEPFEPFEPGAVKKWLSFLHSPF